ncbi:MAG: nucleotide exchange factor GrpE [Methanomicrobiaceae archaeon]|nr:nucleotide exchange factor GrpE [Methanomicrobiaceae archaeon]
MTEEKSGQNSAEVEHEELETLRKEYAGLHERFLRLAADFDNYKKRASRDAEARVNLAVEDFAAEMLDVLDNLERACSAEETRLREGLDQIHKLLSSLLEKRGIEPIACLRGQFDPSCQEAVSCIPSDVEEGIVIDEITRGYRMNDRVLRYAKVVVSKGKREEE